MLTEYKVLTLQFRNYKLLGSFAGILKGLLGHLDTISGGLKWEGMRIVQECKLTGRRGCQENTQMVVSSWQRTLGRRGKAHGCLGHTARIWHWWHRKNMHPQNTTTIIPDGSPIPPLYIWFISPPSIQEDNRAVCPSAAGASVNVGGSRFMAISSQDWVVTGK